ncbi:MAG TPA: SOS response-associated peptidase [Myxococcales bacterium]|jgi:putative SOS response-associated peptidase YedK|nr:SOS response-associated peptidase [Myxococcales bacterium]
MCGRVTCRTTSKELQRAFELAFEPLDLRPRYNIAPSQPLPAVVRRPDRVLQHFRWGLIPAWASDEKIGNRMINARAETLGQKFRDALELRRCLVAVDGFYEWKAEGAKQPKTPMYIHLKSGGPFGIAGLWERWKSPAGEVVESCTIITVPPNPMMKGIHNRMPAILTPDQYEAWLDPKLRDADRLAEMLRPYGGGDLEAYSVSQAVNSPANEGPECVVPQAPPPKKQLELL